MATLQDLFPDDLSPPLAAPLMKEALTAALPQPEVTLDQILAGLPFAFLSGSAGTGKTFLAREIIKHRQDAVLCATTGIAAVNLGDATTINSLLAFYNTQSLMEHYASGFLQYRLRMLRRSGVKLIVCDEVSMLDGDQLTILCQAFDELDLKKTYDQDLGEVNLESRDDDQRMKLLLVGDFAQLPPVEASFAFESAEWSRFHDHTFQLRTIRRQGDPLFIEALQAVRKGHAAKALPILESRIVPSLDFNFNGTTIVADNASVDRINNLRHAKLMKPPLTWKAQRAGEQQKDWIRLIPQELTVKVGALVMILMNKPCGMLEPGEIPSGFFYVNGDLATVLDADPNGIRVMLHRTFEEVVVTPAVKEWKEATGKKNPRWNIKGSVSYMPLRLAYATTVHKCVSGNTRLPVHGVGYQEISDVRIGAITPYGIVKAIARSEHPAYRITTERGYSVVTSGDHKWVTRTGLIAAQDLTDTSELKLNAGPPFPGWNSLEPEAWWWLGAIVGDGSYNDRGRGQIHFACMHRALGDRYAAIGTRTWGPTITWRKDGRGLYLSSVPLRKRLEGMGLEYATGRYKRIPKTVWFQGPERRSAFLQGLFDADGSCGRNRAVLTTASEHMSEDVQELLLTLGIVSKRTSYKSGYKERGDRYWQVWVGAESLDDFKRQVGFWHPEKAAKLQKSKPNRTLNPTLTYDRVVTVEPLNLTLPMYDIEIESPHLLTFGPFLGSNSQSLSLDEVQVGIASWMFSKPSMLYVALSRCRTLEGLRIVGTPKMLLGRCAIDPKIQRWL